MLFERGSLVKLPSVVKSLGLPVFFSKPQPDWVFMCKEKFRVFHTQSPNPSSFPQVNRVDLLKNS